MKTPLKLALSICVILTTACSGKSYNTAEYAVGGGVVGAGLGAGIGAAIASGLANGDVAASALLGTAIGLPVGALAGAIYADHMRTAPLRAMKAQVESNAEQIKQNEHDIVELRNNVDVDSAQIVIDDSTARTQYNGARLGSPN